MTTLAPEQPRVPGSPGPVRLPDRAPGPAMRPAAAGRSESGLVHELEAVSSRRLPVQTSLRIGSVDDPLEHEAEQSADRVVRRACACGGTPGADGECAECRARRLASVSLHADGRHDVTSPA
jgi:hypothetical protein